MKYFTRLSLGIYTVAVCVGGTLAQDGLVYGENPNKPVELTDDLLCESCHALVRQTWLKRHESEADIYDTISTVCQPANLKVYRMIPPTMAKGCSEVLNRYEGEIESDLYEAFSSGSLWEAEDEICGDICGDVGFSEPPVDAEKMPEAGRRPPGYKPKKRAPARRKGSARGAHSTGGKRKNGKGKASRGGKKKKAKGGKKKKRTAKAEL